MAAIFGKRKIIFKTVQSIFLTYPVGQKFRRNSSISHGLGVTSNLSFTFLSKIRKFKMAAIFGKRKIFLEKCAEYLA